MSGTGPKLRDVHTKLFADDVAELIRVAKANRSKWQIELRQLVHRALRGERREITVIKETP